MENDYNYVLYLRSGFHNSKKLYRNEVQREFGVHGFHFE